ncbi:MAG: CotH kinase family protein [Flavobacteriales bacterium]|nr:CotH kinase family protein [Flavobacteriales bacterium]
MRKELLLSTAIGLCCALPLRAQVVINEVTSANWTLIQDNFGEYRDWVELFNTTAAPVDLGGWYLSDSQNNNMKWQFPAGATIAANGYLIVWCSGNDVSVGNVHHTNFRISQTQGERAVLTTPAGDIVTNFKIEQPVKTNHSWGRTSDGANTWDIFLTPTPGAANANPSPYYAEKPVFDPPGGFYAGPVSVSISTIQPNAQIRYTLDGSTPTAASALYGGPININTTTVLRAGVFSNDPGIPPSFIEFFTYFINESHTIPVYSLAGNADVLGLFNGNAGLRPVTTAEYYGEDGQLRDKTVGDANKHGNDSWAYGQRGIDYISRDQFGYNDGFHYPIFRTKSRDQYQRVMFKAAANDNYPFSGGAHIRDAFVMAHSQVNDFYLDERSYEPCILYVNGQYWGVYDVREKVDDPDFTEYYYDQKRNDLYFLKTWGGTWEEYGQGQAMANWNALRNYIATNDMGDQAAWDYVKSQYNWKSLIDYIMLNSYIVSKDWLNWNTAWWRGMNPLGDGRRWRYALWDMDASFGHYVNYTGIPDTSPDADPCNAENLPNPGGQGHTVIATKLLEEQPEFKNWYVNRYIDLGNTAYSCDQWLPFLDSLIAIIEPEMPRQVARWGGSMAGWQANVQTLRTFIEQRCTAIQEGLIDCYDLDGPYDMVFNVDPPESGRIRINSITPDTYPFTGVYYGGIEATLEALPDEGWVFSHWEVFGSTTIQPSMNDSLVTAEFFGVDSIVAHFIPPTKYEVMLNVTPEKSGSIVFDGVLYEELPVIVEVPEGMEVQFHVVPALYYDFLHWTVENHMYVPADSTRAQLAVTFWETDTIIAHLKPQDHVFYLPNAFTPNGDGINDVWIPVANVVDLESYHLRIYDRWGLLLFETRDPWEGWDGTIGGQLMPDGVYVYQADVVDAIKRDRYNFAGHLTLFR